MAEKAKLRRERNLFLQPKGCSDYWVMFVCIAHHSLTVLDDSLLEALCEQPPRITSREPSLHYELF